MVPWEGRMHRGQSKTWCGEDARGGEELLQKLWLRRDAGGKFGEELLMMSRS